MSSDPTQPINQTRFAHALESLPLDSLHAKAAELHNSIRHLKSSNDQMLPFADEGDDECREAMFENLTVIGRMNERLGLLRAEVERRGMRWGERRVEDGEVLGGDLEGEGIVVNGEGGVAGRGSGRLTDEELRRRVEAQMGEDGDEDGEDGVHL